MTVKSKPIFQSPELDNVHDSMQLATKSKCSLYPKIASNQLRKNELRSLQLLRHYYSRTAYILHSHFKRSDCRPRSSSLVLLPPRWFIYLRYQGARSDRLSTKRRTPLFEASGRLNLSILTELLR